MFAVAIWDAPRQRLVLARDRVGKKPLYYLQNERRAAVRIGDEGDSRGAAATCRGVNAGALLELLHVRLRRRRRRRPSTACSGSSPARRSIVDVRAGTSTRRARSGAGPTAPDRDAMPEAEAIERLRAELTEAVRIRLRSDVPLGAFLSGGMDSAAVLALMTKQSSRPVKTFTIGFGDPAYDELDDARATAAALRRRSSRADRDARLRPRRRDAGACTTTSRSPTRRRFRRSTSRSSRAVT